MKYHPSNWAVYSIPKIYRWSFYIYHLGGYIEGLRRNGDNRKDYELILEWMDVWNISETEMPLKTLTHKHWKYKQDSQDYLTFLDTYITDNIEKLKSLSRLKKENEELKCIIAELTNAKL